MEAHRSDLSVRSQAKGCRRAPGFTLKRGRVGDALRHETDQPCNLLLSDPIHPFPQPLSSSFAWCGANYRTSQHARRRCRDAVRSWPANAPRPPQPWTTDVPDGLRTRPMT